MKNYVIELMTKKDFNAMMNGSYQYTVEKIIVTAENEEKALQTAEQQYPTMVVNNYVQTVDELEEKERAEKQAIAEREAAEEQARAERKARAAERAAEDLKNGITPEMKKAAKMVKTYNTKIATLEEQYKKELAYLKRQLKQWEKMAKGE